MPWPQRVWNGSRRSRFPPAAQPVEVRWATPEPIQVTHPRHHQPRGQSVRSLLAHLAATALFAMARRFSADSAAARAHEFGRVAWVTLAQCATAHRSDAHADARLCETGIQ